MRHVLLALAFLVPAAAARADVRFVVLHDAELLPSETRALAAIEKKLGARMSSADPAEAAAARAGKAAASWAGAEAVLVLEVLPPTAERKSTGLGAILIFRPPAAEPVYAERVEGPIDLPLLRHDALAPWLARAVKLVGSQAR